jgi:hypothetical protein
VISRSRLGIVALAAACVTLAAAALPARDSTTNVGPDDISGVVTGPNGPEAGVWVIAETNDLPTKFVRIVVTDDQGRYLIPDLPKANYSVWVRGYGLVDSPKSSSTIGRTLALKAVPAPNPRAAAEIYPAGYWYSLLQVPAKSEFPGTGPEGNGISPTVKSQADFIRTIKSGTCTACHQIGTKGNARDSRAVQDTADEHGTVGATGAVGTGRARECSPTSGGSGIRARSGCSPTGRTASRRARCHRRRAVLRGSSATS